MKRIPIQVRVPIIEDKQDKCPYEHPYGYIYLVRNKVNGHMYVGQHVWHKPWIDNRYTGSGVALHEAYIKYGVNNFCISIIEWSEKDKYELNELEKYWIDMFGTYRFPFHYNLTVGGDGVGVGEDAPNYGMRGESHPMYGKGYKVSGEKNGMYGYEWSQEQREHQSEVLKKYYETRESRCGELHPMFGRRHSIETREKMSESQKRRPPRSEEWRLQVSLRTRGENNPMYGIKGSKHPRYRVKHTEESRKKMSANHPDFSGSKNPNYGNHKLLGGNSPLSKAIVQLSLDGSLIKEYDSISTAERLGRFGHTYLIECCKGKKSSYKGYKWMYKEDYYNQFNT